MRQRSIVLDAVLYRELYKYNALDARLYTRQGFIFSKQVPMDSAIKGGIKDLSERAWSLSDNRLKSNPRDAEALYNRGITEGAAFHLPCHRRTFVVWGLCAGVFARAATMNKC
jgi:hypothetical protein